SNLLSQRPNATLSQISTQVRSGVCEPADCAQLLDQPQSESYRRRKHRRGLLGVLNLPQNFMSRWDFNSVDAGSRGVLLTRSQQAIHNKCSGWVSIFEGLDPCKGETLVKRLMIVAMVVGCLGAFAFGQTANAVLTGTAVDSSGALIPGVEVTATNVETGVT